MFSLTVVSLTVLVVIIIIIKLLHNCRRTHHELESFGANITEFVFDGNCVNEDNILDLSNANDKTSRCPRIQCDSIKCWYIKAIDDSNEFFDFQETYNHVRIIDRDADSKCFTGDNLLQNIDVSIKTQDEWQYNSLTETTDYILNQTKIENAHYVFYSKDLQHEMPDTNINEDAKITVVVNIKGNFYVDKEFVCRRAGSNGEINQTLDLIEVTFKRTLQKLADDKKGKKTFQVVYKRVVPNKISSFEAERFKYSLDVIIVEDTDTMDTLKKKYCDTECDEIVENADYWVFKDKYKEYHRTNYVNPQSNTSPVTTNSLCIIKNNATAVKSADISKNIYVYEKSEDIYKVQYKFNNPDIWYPDENNANITATLNTCKPDEYYNSRPKKKFIASNKWIQTTDLECYPHKKCDNVETDNVSLKIKTLSLKPQTSSKQFKIVNRISELMHCTSVQVEYLCKIVASNDDILKSPPILTIKKKNKEVLLKHIIDVNNNKFNQLISSDIPNSSVFQAFNFFKEETDNVRLFIDSGSYGIEVRNVVIKFNCQMQNIVGTEGTQYADASCRIEYSDLSECDYETQFHDSTSDFKCKTYANSDCLEKYVRKTSVNDAQCLKNAKYTPGLDSDSYESIYKDDQLNVKSYDGCVRICDARKGCVGIDYVHQLNECMFYGSETLKIEINNTNNDTYNVGIYDFDNNIETSRNVTGTFVKLYESPVYVKKLVIDCKSKKFKGYIMAYDYKNRVQRWFSNENDDKDTNLNNIDRYEMDRFNYVFENIYKAGSVEKAQGRLNKYQETSQENALERAREKAREKERIAREKAQEIEAEKERKRKAYMEAKRAREAKMKELIVMANEARFPLRKLDYLIKTRGVTPEKMEDYLKKLIAKNNARDDRIAQEKAREKARELKKKEIMLLARAGGFPEQRVEELISRGSPLEQIKAYVKKRIAEQEQKERERERREALSKKGRFVKLEHTEAYNESAPGNADDRNKIININELEVFDTKGTNLAAGKPAIGSKIAFSGNARLTDGNLNHYIHTKGEKEVDYLQVDLGSEQEINKLVITNRVDCCKNRAIGIKAVILAADGTTVIMETPAIRTTADTYTLSFPGNTWS